MTHQEENELIMKCLSKSNGLGFDRSYELAFMAIHKQPLKGTVTLEECMVYIEYRLIVVKYQRSKKDSA